MKIEELNKDCTGCGACAAVCPTKAVTMKANGEGFYYPVIGESCIACGMCDNTCPIINKSTEKSDVPSVFAAYNKDLEDRKASSSGGIFILLARDAVRRGGAVYGAAVCEGPHIAHIRVDTEDGLHRLQGSKYVQSSIDRSLYESIKQDVQMGREVLFSGTPCQVAAVRRYVKDTKLLCTASFVCHGVPSPAVFDEYIELLKSREGAEVNSVSFRDKSFGWEEFSMAVGFDNGNRYVCPLHKDLYLRAFLCDVALRESCYKCAFKGLGGYDGTDIIMSDWWGAEDGVLPEKLDGMGVSAIYIKSPAGHTMWERIKEQCVFAPMDFEYAASIPFSKSDERPKSRDTFIGAMQKEGFEKALMTHHKTPVSKKIRRVLVKIAKRLKIAKFLKKILVKK